MHCIVLCFRVEGNVRKLNLLGLMDISFNVLVIFWQDFSDLFFYGFFSYSVKLIICK